MSCILVLLCNRLNGIYLHTQLSDQHTWMVVNLLSGGLAGATALFVSYPFDVARTRYVYLCYMMFYNEKYL